MQSSTANQQSKSKGASAPCPDSVTRASQDDDLAMSFRLTVAYADLGGSISKPLLTPLNTCGSLMWKPLLGFSLSFWKRYTSPLRHTMRYVTSTYAFGGGLYVARGANPTSCQKYRRLCSVILTKDSELTIILVEHRAYKMHAILLWNTTSSSAWLPQLPSM